MTNDNELKINKNTTLQYITMLLGSLLYAGAFNTVILPIGVYSGNITGISQILNDGVNMITQSSEYINVTGIILFCFNIPLFIGAYKTLSKKFFIRSGINMIVQTLFLLFIPIPKTPILLDTLTAVVIGGILMGYGCGLVLKSGASSGGTDILGVWFAQKYPSVSIGKVQMAVSSVVFIYCAIRYDIEVVVYSVILLCMSSFVLDKSHTQNIKLSVIILTKKENFTDFIMHDLVRGVTKWNGEGCYTQTPTYVYMTVISKYEANRLRHGVLDADPNAFIIFQNNIDVQGNFIKRLNSVF